jgi:DNA-binding NtrC family response regulator
LVKQKKARVSKVSPEALQVLIRYQWPGNVRELENVIYRSAVIAQGDTILLKDLPAEIREAVDADSANTSEAPFDATRTTVDENVALAHARQVAEQIAGGQPDAALTIEHALDFIHEKLNGGDEPILSRLEREMITRVMRAEQGNLLKASEKLGITRATLRKRVDELGLRV